MDRPQRDYVATMGLQHQQNRKVQWQHHPLYGDHPQAQHFLQQIHGLLFILPHSSLQLKFIFSRLFATTTIDPSIYNASFGRSRWRPKFFREIGEMSSGTIMN